MPPQNNENDQPNNLKQPIPVINIPDYQPNYATKMNSPRKEEAIIIEAQENLNLLDYATTVSQLTNQQIKFIGKLSRNRIRMFLSSEQAAINFTTKHPAIEIKGYRLKTRPYINSAKKLYISGACPSIPNEYLTQCLETMDIQVIAPMQHIKAFNTDDDHLINTHLDKRFILFKPNHEKTIPNSVIILYDDIEHMVYLEIENNLCRKCKLSGHSAAKCPNIITTTDLQNRLQIAASEGNPRETIKNTANGNLLNNLTKENITSHETINTTPLMETEEQTTSEQNDISQKYRDPASYVTICYEDPPEDEIQPHITPVQTPKINQKGTDNKSTELGKDNKSKQEKEAKLGQETGNGNINTSPIEKKTINETWITPGKKLTRNVKNLTIKTDNLNPPKEKTHSPKRKLEEKSKSDQTSKLPKI